jgi:carbon monoxide dehydrogenase subunit G
MRISESIEIAAPPSAAWEFLADPDNTLKYMSGLTRWEPVGGRGTGLGARYRMLIRIGAADVGGMIEIVEWTPERELAWSSITGLDQRGRWRVRELADGGTRVELRYAYGVAGSGIAGMIAERVAAPALRRNMRRSLWGLKHLVEQRERAETRRSRARA